VRSTKVFISFVVLADLSANGLSDELLSQLETLAVDYKNKLIGQGYDGASIMSGKHRGVVALNSYRRKLRWLCTYTAMHIG